MWWMRWSIEVIPSCQLSGGNTSSFHPLWCCSVDRLSDGLSTVESNGYNKRMRQQTPSKQGMTSFMFWRTLSRAQYLTTQQRQHASWCIPSISSWDESLSNSQQYASFLPLFWIRTVRENQPSASDGSIDDNRQARLASFHHEYIETRCHCIFMVQSQHYKVYRFPHSSINLLRFLKSAVSKSFFAVKSSIRYCTTRDLTSCCQHPTMILATSMHFIYALDETILEGSVC